MEMIRISEKQLRYILTEAYLQGEGAGRAEANQEPWPKHDSLIERLIELGKSYERGQKPEENA